MKVLNWNAQADKAPPRDCKVREFAPAFARHDADVICLTEAFPDLMPDGGETVTSDLSGWPGGHEERGARKVVLWSRSGWTDVDGTGDPDMPPGRFVRATTQTSAGDITFMAVCIPWPGSRTGPAFEPPRRKWDDHETYLECLGRMLSRAPTSRLVVVRDFNQRVRPRVRSSRVAAALHGALVSRLTVATAALGHDGRRAIDHIALGADLHCRATGVTGNMHEGRRLSDHFGVFADVFARDP